MSKSVNHVTLLGNITRDPELRQTPSGQTVISLSLALNRPYKNQSGEWQEATDYIDCVAWSSLAERIHDRCYKGSRVVVIGKLQSRSWEKDGQKRSKVEVLASDVVFLDKKTDDTKGSSDNTSTPNNQGSYSSVYNNDEEPIDLSDIPF